MKRIEKPNMVELYNELGYKSKINGDENSLELNVSDIFMWANKFAYECVCYWIDSRFFNELNALEVQGVKVDSPKIKTMKEMTTPEDFILSMNECESMEQLEKKFRIGSLVCRLKILNTLKNEKMNAREFFNLVSAMRAAQRAYFRARKMKKDREKVFDYLSQSIELENKVDDEIKRVENLLNKQKNG